jgi:serine/threonine-protein phosphatase 2A regulatory subunit A
MEAKGEQQDLYQVALLIDQLKHDDVHFRVSASSNLARIAAALGPERTRDELIPFLCGEYSALLLLRHYTNKLTPP